MGAGRPATGSLPACVVRPWRGLCRKYKQLAVTAPRPRMSYGTGEECRPHLTVCRWPPPPLLPAPGAAACPRSWPAACAGPCWWPRGTAPGAGWGATPRGTGCEVRQADADGAQAKYTQVTVRGHAWRWHIALADTRCCSAAAACSHARPYSLRATAYAPLSHRGTAMANGL